MTHVPYTVKSRKLIYARGFPYGAPLVMLRGGATRDPEIQQYLRDAGFRWDGSLYAYKNYMDGGSFATLLMIMRDEFACDVQPKSDLDANYILDLEG